MSTRLGIPGRRRPASRAPARRPRQPTVGPLGWISGPLAYVGSLAHLGLDALWWATLAPLRGRGRFRTDETVRQMHRVSVESLGVITLVTTSVGMILALQLTPVLQLFGIVEFLPEIISIAWVRELAPLLVGIVLAGFLGAAIAAEIGSMKVSEELLALEVGGYHPIRFLIVPRLLAAGALMPPVTLIAEYLGNLGGLIIAARMLDLDPLLYVEGALAALELQDLLTGLFKASVFGFIIAAIACREGLRVAGGAEGVGRATRHAVVRSVVAIVISDLFLTVCFHFVFE